MNKYDIIILGANGQLGNDLVKIFQQNQLCFLGLSRKNFNARADSLDGLIKFSPKFIINCIATTNVDGCEDDSELAFTINSHFPYQLAKLCNLHGITLIHLSTDYVFDGTKALPYIEEDPPKPLNIYGLSKYAGELAIKNYHDKYFIFRVSSLFGKAGASGKGGNFITTMQRLGRELAQVSVIADQITCPTATLDIAKCIHHFIAMPVNDYGIYNCVSNNSCSWFDFAREIFILSDLDVNKVLPAEFATYKFKAKRPQYGVLAIDKLSRYYAMPSWQHSLKHYFS